MDFTHNLIKALAYKFLNRLEGQHTFCPNKPNALALAPISEVHGFCKEKYDGVNRRQLISLTEELTVS